eukprot:TRINITY_DN8213_c0_g1_i1.p1 TRINITY_DN8213_c0_g1~~TRINITY_DN8213_c0_g1_i1.p1  ORF type:complete len:1002 (-),score=220.64 TRINITY_DN8213_c0_g1_i1:108-3092(-)
MARLIGAAVLLICTIALLVDSQTIPQYKINYMSAALLNVSSSLRTLQSSVQSVVDTPMTTCTFYRGCPQNTGFGTYDPTGLAPAGPNYLFGNTSVNLSRMVHQPYASNAGSANYSCWSQTMLPSAIANLQAHSNFTMFQYVTWINGQLDSYPAENWTASYGCPSNSFDPRTRSWYVTAMTPPMNILIVISTKDCASGCLANAKAAALAVLARCGFWNYVGIVAYDLVVSQMLPLGRATTSYIAQAQAFVQALTPTAAGTVNVGMAMQQANGMLAGNSQQGDPVVIWLSNGSNDDQSVDPIAAIQQNSILPHVFSVLIGTNTTNVLARRFACVTNAAYVSLSAAVTPAAAIDTVFGAVSAGIVSSVIRPSEPYIDDASGVNTVSLGLVLYQTGLDSLRVPVGVVSIDVLTSFLTNNGNITQDELVSFLLSSQVYTTIAIPSTVVNAVSNEVDVCSKVDPSGPTNYTPLTIQLFGVWVAVSVVCTLIMMISVGCRAKASHGKRRTVGTLIAVFIGMLMVVSMSVAWAVTWPQYVRNVTFKSAAMTTVAHQDNPYRCCDIVNCICQEAYMYPSCLQLQATLTAGPCNVGYYCCSRICYSCNCYTRCSRRLLTDQASGEEQTPVDYTQGNVDADGFALDDEVYPYAPGNMSSLHQRYTEEMTGDYGLHELAATQPQQQPLQQQPQQQSMVVRASHTTCRTICSTCCNCVYSVSFRRCDVTCGTCFNPVVTFEYFNKGLNQYVNVSRSSSCSRNDYACVLLYYSGYANIGQSVAGFYNPNNPQDIAFDVHIDMVAFGFVASFAGLSVLLFLVYTIRCRCERSYSYEPDKAPLTSDVQQGPVPTYATTNSSTLPSAVQPSQYPSAGAGYSSGYASSGAVAPAGGYPMGYGGYPAAAPGYGAPPPPSSAYPYGTAVPYGANLPPYQQSSGYPSATGGAGYPSAGAPSAEMYDPMLAATQQQPSPQQQQQGGGMYAPAAPRPPAMNPTYDPMADPTYGDFHA